MSGSKIKLARVAKNGWQNSPMLRNASTTFALRFSGAALLFIFNWLVVQLLGVTDSGVFFLAYTLLNVFSTLALFGVDQYQLRKISTLDEQPAKRRFILGGYFLLLTSSALCLLLTILAEPMSHFFDSPALARSLRLLAPTVIFLTLITYLGAAARARRRFNQSVFILTNSYYLLAILFFVGAWAAGDTTLSRISLFLTAAVGAGLYVDSLLVARIYRFQRFEELLSRQRWSNLLELGRRSWHLFLVSVIYLGFGSVTLLLVGFFLSDADVSIYAVAEKEAKLLTFSLFAINIILAPAVSKYSAERNLPKLNREVQKATILSILFSLPFLVAFLLAPGFFMGIFGQEYVQGANILRILSIGQAINAATGAVFITMTMAHLEKRLNIISLIALVLQLLLGITLIPALGVTGASWATLVGWSFVNILGLYYLNRFHSIRIFPTWNLVKELAGRAKNSFS